MLNVYFFYPVIAFVMMQCLAKYPTVSSLGHFSCLNRLLFITKPCFQVAKLNSTFETQWCVSWTSCKVRYNLKGPKTMLEYVWIVATIHSYSDRLFECLAL